MKRINQRRYPRPVTDFELQQAHRRAMLRPVEQARFLRNIAGLGLAVLFVVIVMLLLEALR
jgi:hypothetical protein